MLAIGVDQALTGKMMMREIDEGATSQSASPSPSPRQRQRRQPGSSYAGTPKSAPREAWTAEGDALYSSRPGHDRRGSGPNSRPGTAQKNSARGGGCPAAPDMSMSVEWQNHTLFGGEKNTNPRAKRGFATTFRRPSSCRQTPHTRPIFVVGPDAQDPRMCVDINAPQRFSSFERTRYELAWRKTDSGGGKPLPEAPAATIRNIGNSGRPSRPASTGRPSGMDGRRSCPPNRPDSVASAGPYRGPSGPSPMPGQRPPLPARPMSSTPVQRSFCSPTPPPAPACWSGA